MAVERKDRVRDQTSTTGTGPFTIGLLAPVGFRTFAAFTNGATVRYSVVNAANTEWEVGQGVWSSGTSTLTRASITASSNSGAAVNFSAGVKAVTSGPQAVDLSEAATLAGVETLTNKTLTNPAVPIVTLADDVSLSWNAASGSMARVTIGGNRTLAAPTNLKPGPYYLFVTQDGVGSRTLNYGSEFVHAATPQLSSSPNATDCFYYVSDGTKLYGGIFSRGDGSTGTGTGSSLPSKILVSYFSTFSGTINLTAVPLDFNVIHLFTATPSGTSGTFVAPVVTTSNYSAANIQTCRARGQKVVLSCGGSGNRFAFLNRTQSTNFVDSFKAMYTALGGLDGCEFAFFDATSLLTTITSEVVWIAQQLKGFYGSSFVVAASCTPDDTAERNLLVALSNAGVLDYAQPRFYGDAAMKAVGWVSGRTATWVSLMGTATKVVVGLSAEGDFTTQLTLAECTREWGTIETASPTIRGAGCWSAQTNAGGGNVWGTEMAAQLPEGGVVVPPAPSKVFAAYFESWTTSMNITAVPTIFNTIYLFNAQPVDQTSGTFSWPFSWNSNVSPANVQVCRARGQKVILSCGGAGQAFPFTTRQQSTNFVSSFQSMATAFGGVDGCDMNNYESGVESLQSEMIWIGQQLKSIYGSSFLITSPPEPDAQYQKDLCSAMYNAGALDYAAMQFYDWVGFKDPGFISGRVNTWVTLMGAANRVVVGLPADYSPSTSPTLAECTREWDIIEAAHPTIRGAFGWSAQTNNVGGNVWGTTMAARVL